MHSLINYLDPRGHNQWVDWSVSHFKYREGSVVESVIVSVNMSLLSDGIVRSNPLVHSHNYHSAGLEE